MVGDLMFKTTLLKKEDYNYKDFSSIDPDYKKQNKFNKAKLRLVSDVQKMNGFISCPNFYFTDGSVYLKEPNTVYSLEYIPYNTNLILPKNIQLFDWIGLFYEQTTALTKLSHEALTKINIRGNGNRIMGLDEPLYCDMPFISLRLTFLGDVDGWVIT
jgi:hypothetical protein